MAQRGTMAGKRPVPPTWLMLSVPLRHHSQTDTSIRCWRQAYSEVRLGSDGGAQQRRQLCGIVRGACSGIPPWIYPDAAARGIPGALPVFYPSWLHASRCPKVLRRARSALNCKNFTAPCVRSIVVDASAMDSPPPNRISRTSRCKAVSSFIASVTSPNPTRFSASPSVSSGAVKLSIKGISFRFVRFFRWFMAWLRAIRNNHAINGIPLDLYEGSALIARIKTSAVTSSASVGSLIRANKYR